MGRTPARRPDPPGMPATVHLRRTRPGEVRSDARWVFTVQAGGETGTQYWTPSGKDHSIRAYLATVPEPRHEVVMSCGRLKVTFTREQWVRVQDYLSLFLEGDP